MTMAARGLAKLIEELGELGQVAGKRLAYYRTDEHPDGKGPLSERLADEIADVMAACTLVVDLHGLDEERIRRRVAAKLATFRAWHEKPDNNEHGIDALSHTRGT
jgi:NTP pyrophosphatase (non-canonical NTP hydrolase)